MKLLRLITAGGRPLRLPGGEARAIPRPDLRHIFVPRLSGAPTPGEVDFDDLIIHQAWRSYDPDRPGEVRYLMYELSQRDPGEETYTYFWKAVRLLKVTRVPRYLRQATGTGPSIVIDQQRDLLAALRDQGVLFLNVIAKADDTPMLFCYGVQGVGPTPEEAQAQADAGWAALRAQLDGLYQQLEYRQLSVFEGEALVRYQNEWDHIAMARGRPVPTGSSLGSASALDGNRTDVESTLNQLEAFLRGMSDRQFILSLVTVPVTASEMTLAWRNITRHLSKIRSEQQGSRSFTAGVSLPITFANSLGDTAGNTHAVGASQGVGATEGVSRSVSDGVSASSSTGETLTRGATVGSAVTDSVAQGVSRSNSLADTVSYTLGHGVGVSDTVSQSVGRSVGITDSVTQGVSVTDGITHGVSLGASVSDAVSAQRTEGFSQGLSAGWSQSLANGTQETSQWSQNLGRGLQSQISEQSGWQAGQSQSEQISYGYQAGASRGGSISGQFDKGYGLDGQLGTVSGGWREGLGEGYGEQFSKNIGAQLGYGGQAGVSSQVSETRGSSLGETLNWGETLGGSVGQSVTATNSVQASQQQSASQTVGFGRTQTVGEQLVESAALSRSVGQTFGVGQALTRGLSESVSVGRTVGQTFSEALSTGRTVGQSVGETLTAGRSMSASQAQSVAQAQSLSQTQGVSRTSTSGVSQAVTQNQALSDAYTVAMSRSYGTAATLGAIPSIGVVMTKAQFDEAKRLLGDILEAQMRRYVEGIESGAFLVQMSLLCPDRETLLGGAALLKAAFWGPGTKTERLPQPFHVITDFEDDERGRLLTHARAFTSYRRREPVTEIVEPYLYSSYVTSYEAATFCHPPTAESIGLLAVHDSMPVMAMPADRAGRQLRIGRLVNGERGKVSDVPFGVDPEELTHTLIAGTTGSGKTTTLMALLSELVKVEREVVVRPDPDSPHVEVRRVKAGIVGLDWMSNMRDLASVVEPDRFRFYSVAKPHLGRFLWNPLAVPDPRMNPIEWANDIADQMAISFNLGEFGRALIAEVLGDLYTANRLEKTVLLPEKTDPSGRVLRPEVSLPAIDEDDLPEGAVTTFEGKRVANVLTCPELSRLVGMEHMAARVLAMVEEASTPEGGRLYGTAMRDRLQSLWRRIQYFAPGSMFSGTITCDHSLSDRRCLTVPDLIDPDRGLVSVIEADGLDLTNRRFVLGSVLLAIWRYGQFHGPGVFDHGGAGPGTFVCLEEAHELFGPQGEEEDRFSASTRTQLYESLFRRARALGMKLVAVVQNCGSIPEAVTSNVSTVVIHRQYAEEDRRRAFSLLNWSNQLSQQQREWRYLGEMARGFCIVRLDAKESYLESAPIHILTDPPSLARVSDQQLARLASRRT